MRNYTGYIIDYSDGNLTEKKRRWFEHELLQNSDLKQNYDLFKQVNDYMRGRFDLEEVQNDPALLEINTITQQMTSIYCESSKSHLTNYEFIKNSLTNKDTELQKVLDQTKVDIQKNNVDEITKEWVNDWNAKKQTTDLATKNRQAFISSSINDESSNINLTKKKRNKIYALRIAGFATAAMIAALFTIKTLSPSYNSETVFQEYYKPLNAYSSTTRNSAKPIDQLSGAVEMYKQGQFKAASTAFSDLMLKDPQNITCRFFGGITQIELGEYNQAIKLLNEVIVNNGEYKKEAQWYLGLTYLKIGEIQKVKGCLKELSESDGYYKDQAQSLLNHLK